MQSFRITEFVSRYIAYLALIIVVLTFSILVPQQFISLGNLGVVLQNSAVLCIVAIGVTFIIIGGSIDLSVGSVMAFSGAITASMTGPWGSWAFIISPIIGLLVGAVSGCVFVYGRIPSFVVSLGMLSIARGATIIFTGGTPVAIPLDSTFYMFGTPPVPIIIAGITAVVAAALMHYTTFGRYTYAIGGDEEKARILGVPVDGVKLAMFILSGFCAGLGGGVLTSQLGSGSPTVGVGFELLAISAVVIGGTPLTGGLGNIVGTVVGSLVITTLANGLILVGVSTNVQTILTGVVLIVAVMVSIRRGKLRLIK
jgi:ribose/xylose/arabinose/galactoside ABC-type transport system permease subunit